MGQDKLGNEVNGRTPRGWTVPFRDRRSDNRRDGVRHAFGGSDPARPGDRSGRADCRESLVRRAGGEVWEGDRLVEVLVGPATFDVPAPATGRLAEIRGREDDGSSPGPCSGRSRCSRRMPTADRRGRIRTGRQRPWPRPAARAPAVRSPARHDHDPRAIRRRDPLPEGRRTGAPVPGPPFGDGAEPARQVGVPQGGHGAGRDHPPDGRPRVPGGDRPVRTGRSATGSSGASRTPTSAAAARSSRPSPTTSSRSATPPPPPARPSTSRTPSATGIHWGTFEQISQLLYHAKIRQVFAEADAWLRK